MKKVADKQDILPLSRKAALDKIEGRIEEIKKSKNLFIEDRRAIGELKWVVEVIAKMRGEEE